RVCSRRVLPFSRLLTGTIFNPGCPAFRVFCDRGGMQTRGKLSGQSYKSTTAAFPSGIGRNNHALCEESFTKTHRQNVTGSADRLLRQGTSFTAGASSS